MRPPSLHRYWALLFVVAVAGFGLEVARAESAYVLMRMPHGVSVELPRNWHPLSSNQKTTINAVAQANAELAGESIDSELPTAANYYDEFGKTAALMNVRYYPDQTVTQAEIRAISVADVRDIDDMMRDLLRKSADVGGFKILEWRGTRVVKLATGVALLVEYKRSPIRQNGNFVVRLVRVMNGSRSFTLTVSYREDQDGWMQPITDRIIRTLRF